MPALSVLSVAAELFPLVKTGGLADVTGALPPALKAERIRMVTLVPGYPGVLSALTDAEVVADVGALAGGPARLIAGRAGHVDLFVLDAPHYFNRPGNPYQGPDGRPYDDNPMRFAALARVAAAIGHGLVADFQPDVVHSHDWHAGLTPAFLHFADAPRPATVMTVHNLAFQGQYPADLFPALGLPPHAFSIHGVEYYGMVGFLKAGLSLADRITTVSPTYAQEIRSGAAGMGLEGLFRARSDVLTGILNGIDTDVWNPATDPSLDKAFDRRRLPARVHNRKALRDRLGLDHDQHAPVFGIISRLTWQKGMDVVLEAIGDVVRLGAQVAVLGAGDRSLEDGFRWAAGAFAGRLGVVIGYDEDLAHQIQAGSDALLVPSRFEPCGLTQLCALRYGAVPVAARVGGLADTIIDANEMALSAGVGTGILFGQVARDPFIGAVQRTLAAFRDADTWKKLQRNGMATDVSWAGPARHYAALYREVVATRGA